MHFWRLSAWLAAPITRAIQRCAVRVDCGRLTASRSKKRFERLLFPFHVFGRVRHDVCQFRHCVALILHGRIRRWPVSPVDGRRILYKRSRAVGVFGWPCFAAVFMTAVCRVKLWWRPKVLPCRMPIVMRWRRWRAPCVPLSFLGGAKRIKHACVDNKLKVCVFGKKICKFAKL